MKLAADFDRFATQAIVSLLHVLVAWLLASRTGPGVVAAVFLGLLVGSIGGRELVHGVCGVALLEFDGDGIRAGSRAFRWVDLVGVRRRAVLLHFSIAFLFRAGDRLEIVSVRARDYTGSSAAKLRRIQAMRLRFAGREGLEQPIPPGWSFRRCAREVALVNLLVPLVLLGAGVAAAHWALTVMAVVEMLLLYRACGGRVTVADWPERMGESDAELGSVELLPAPRVDAVGDPWELSQPMPDEVAQPVSSGRYR